MHPMKYGLSSFAPLYLDEFNWRLNLEPLGSFQDKPHNGHNVPYNSLEPLSIDARMPVKVLGSAIQIIGVAHLSIW